MAEFVYHVGGAAFVFDVQVHGPVALLLAVLRHKGGLLTVGESKKTGVVPFCWTSLFLPSDYATRPSLRRRSMMLMPYSVLIRLSRYQTM